MHEKLKSQLSSLYTTQAEELLELVKEYDITSIEQLQKILSLYILIREPMPRPNRLEFIKNYMELPESLNGMRLEYIFIAHKEFISALPTSSVALVLQISNGHNYTVGRCVARLSDGDGGYSSNYYGVFHGGRGNNLTPQDTVFPTREQFDRFLEDLDGVEPAYLTSMAVITAETLNEWF